MSIAKIKYKKIDSKALLLHTQLAKGSLGKDEYRLIQDVGNKCFVLEYKGEKYEVMTFDFVKGLLDAIDNRKKE